MINLSATLKIAFRALRVNKMRSGLTILGIVIGVSAVITMLAIGTGANRQIADGISKMGSNLLIVFPGSITSGGIRLGAGSQATLTLSDADAIQKECPAVADVAPIFGGGAQVVYGNLNWSTSVTGSTPGMLNVRDWSVAEGRAFTGQEVKSAIKVCILGQTVADNLFGGIDPLGKIVRIKNAPFSVIGVLAGKGQNPMGQDEDDVIFVPITTAQRKLFGAPFPGMVRTIMVKAVSLDALDPAQKQITDLLRQKHHLGQKQEDDFTVRNLTQMMQTAQQSSKVMTIFLGVIASISLLVGGIGIMNIMLVSVTERTREIGIRMAVGAKTGDIRLQFIIEALTLSSIGGVTGIVVGILDSKIISTLAGWPTIISPLFVFLAFGFSVLVGMFFGFYPAYKASFLNPIDALRYE